MQSVKQFIKTIILASVIGLAVTYVFAWTGPTATPPGGNVSTPINVSLTSQIKSGALGIGGLLQTGAFQLTTGAEAGRVLTSDASGLASWQIPAGGGGTLSIQMVDQTGPVNCMSEGIDIQVSCPVNTVLIDCGVKNSTNNRRWTDISFDYGSVAPNNGPLYMLTQRDPGDSRICYFDMNGAGHAQCNEQWTLSAYCLSVQ